MTDFSAPRILAISLTFFLAGIVKGVTGMGLPTVAKGVLGAIMPPVAASTLLIAPSFVTNVWQLLSGPSFIELASRLWLMMLGIIVGTIAGSRLIASGAARWTPIGLGAALTLYAAMSLLAWRPSVPAHIERRLSPLVGVATGIITGGSLVVFRRWFLICLLLLGLQLTLRPLL
jgi:uncharacterized membrane protein YfcA